MKLSGNYLIGYIKGLKVCVEFDINKDEFMINLPFQSISKTKIETT